MAKSRLQAHIEPTINEMLRGKAIETGRTITEAVEAAILLLYYSSDQHANRCQKRYLLDQQENR